MDISKDQIDYLKIKHTGILSTKNYYELEGLDQVYNKLSNFSMEDL